MRCLILLPLAFAAIACQPMAGDDPASASAQAQGTTGPLLVAELEPVAFARASCGGCHSVEGKGISPNPASPTFYEIANRTGLTQETLSTYLTDAHNYPDQMDFDLRPKDVEALTKVILDLRDPDYKLPVS